MKNCGGYSTLFDLGSITLLVRLTDTVAGIPSLTSQRYIDYARCSTVRLLPFDKGYGNTGDTGSRYTADKEWNYVIECHSITYD